MMHRAGWMIGLICLAGSVTAGVEQGDGVGLHGGCLLSAPAEAVPDETFADELRQCNSGSGSSKECQQTCNRLFGAHRSGCSISCRDGYYACCTCRGCECLLEYPQLWPRRWP